MSQVVNNMNNPIKFTSCLRCHYPVSIFKGEGICHNCGVKMVWRDDNPFQATTGLITCHHIHKTRRSALECLENKKIYGIGSSGKSQAFWSKYGVVGAIENPQTRARVQILKSTKKWAECGSCSAFHPADYWGDCRNDDYRFWEDELPENADIEYIDYSKTNPKPHLYRKSVREGMTKEGGSYIDAEGNRYSVKAFREMRPPTERRYIYRLVKQLTGDTHIAQRMRDMRYTKMEPLLGMKRGEFPRFKKEYPDLYKALTANPHRKS